MDPFEYVEEIKKLNNLKNGFYCLSCATHYPEPPRTKTNTSCEICNKPLLPTQEAKRTLIIYIKNQLYKRLVIDFGSHVLFKEIWSEFLSKINEK